MTIASTIEFWRKGVKHFSKHPHKFDCNMCLKISTNLNDKCLAALVRILYWLMGAKFQYISPNEITLDYSPHLAE